MARLQNPFDARLIDPSQGSSQLPEGRHPVIIESSEIKAAKPDEEKNKDGKNAFMLLGIRIIDGPFKGFGGSHRLNLWNPHSQTVEIAQKQLSAISHVTGVFLIQDTEDLHNKPFVVEVAKQKDERYTEIKRFFHLNGAEPGKAPPPQATQLPAQPWPQPQPPQPTQLPAQPQWGAPPTATQPTVPPPQPTQLPAQPPPQWGAPVPPTSPPTPPAQPQWPVPPPQPTQLPAPPTWGQPQPSQPIAPPPAAGPSGPPPWGNPSR